MAEEARQLVSYDEVEEEDTSDGTTDEMSRTNTAEFALALFGNGYPTRGQHTVALRLIPEMEARGWIEYDGGTGTWWLTGTGRARRGT